MLQPLFPIIEVFGPTIQGEGSVIGRPSMFIRVGGCDFDCMWCDTAYAKKAPPRQYWVSANVAIEKLKLLADNCKVVTITGGNPLLYDLTPLVETLRREQYTIFVETQGTIWQDWLQHVDEVIVSPKPPSAGTTLSKDSPSFIENCINCGCHVHLKVVVADSRDLEFALGLHKRYFPSLDLCLQPCGIPGAKAEEMLEEYRQLINRVLPDPRFDLRRVRILPQMHRLLWGDTRCV